MLVDSHCHLNHDGLTQNIPDVIKRANEAGVSHMVCICTRLLEFEAVSQIADNYDNVYCSVGIHPHDADKEPVTDVETLVALAKHRKTIGIGETGLDFFYNNSLPEVQEHSFRIHIRAARETGLPIIVHTRDADDKTIEILREEYSNGPFLGLIHCFTAGLAVAECAIELGMYISLSGIITFKNASNLRETVKSVPLDRLVVETDSPFLAPMPHRGKQNEPAYVIHTAEKAAESFCMSFEEMAHTTTNNFFRLFAKAQFY